MRKKYLTFRGPYRPLRVVAPFSFCCTQNKKRMDDKDIKQSCVLGVTFKYHKLRKIVSKNAIFFREASNADFISREL